MTAEILSILSQFGQQGTDQLRAVVPRVSGRTAQSIRFEVTQSETKATLKLLARPYFMAIQTGIKPYPQYNKPSKQFVDEIREWLAGVGGEQGAAYAIARSIHQKGTKLWRQGGNTLISDVINQTFIDKLSAALLQSFTRQYLVSTVNFYGNTSSTSPGA